MVRNDKRSPAGFRSVVVPRLHLHSWSNRVAQISLHTLVSFVMKPRRTRAVPRLRLLGEQGANVIFEDRSREKTDGD